jgi:16S rRNA (cytosine967-C5)-methyltransferase
MVATGGSSDGLAARAVALKLVQGVLDGGLSLDQQMEEDRAFAALPPRDRAFAHALAATTLRRHGDLAAAVKTLVTRPLPKSAGPAFVILLLGAAQLLLMATPAHAAISASVDLAKHDVKARHFAGLINAVLRKVAALDPATLAADPTRNLPDWLKTRLVAAHGPDATAAMARAHAAAAAIDLTVKADAALWAERLGATLLPTGSLRLPEDHAPIPELPGFAEGHWWVQDAAAALPARLAGDVAGHTVLDLCAAPGGKTAQLAAAGATVTAVDDAPARMARLQDNLNRLHLSATCLTADVLTLPEDRQYDLVLLDAPCSATGTIRRHPDLPHLKSARQIDSLVKLQARMLDKAARLVRPGGRLLYCTCSLLPEEGEGQTDAFLARHADFARAGMTAAELGGEAQLLTPRGDFRSHPGMAFGAGTLDGFYAARLIRSAC